MLGKKSFPEINFKGSRIVKSADLARAVSNNHLVANNTSITSLNLPSDTEGKGTGAVSLSDRPQNALQWDICLPSKH